MIPFYKAYPSNTGTAYVELAPESKIRLVDLPEAKLKLLSKFKITMKVQQIYKQKS
jgi:hypothetical protein